MFGFTADAPASRFRRLKEGERTCGCSQTTPHSNVIEPPAEPTEILLRYVDDILRSVRRGEVEKVFKTANSLHPNLEFTIEHETKELTAFLDLLVTCSRNKLSTSWYTKPSDTGVYLSYQACAPTKYKRNIVEGAIHRIHHTTSN